jgi:hypothetical protein
MLKHRETKIDRDRHRHGCSQMHIDTHSYTKKRALNQAVVNKFQVSSSLMVCADTLD